ncbi:MAG: ThuA domain-containing protein [Myxococcota bacterium]
MLFQPKRSVKSGWGAARRILLASFVLMFLSGCELVRTFFPSSDHDALGPAIPADLPRPAILVFSKTNGYRHDEGIAAGVPALEAIAKARGWGFYATENGAVHSAEQLASFDALVWFNVSGDVLDEAQRAALMTFLERGGGFFGIHGTGGDPNYKWVAQSDRLVGARFVGHPMGPQFQEATVRVEARDHPVTRHLSERWVRTDEWYSFDRSVRGEGFEVLATLDESTYSPRMKIAIIDRDLRMGEDHPILWTHCIGRGRALYSAMGHLPEAYQEPEHTRMLEEGMAWVAAGATQGCAVESR